MKQSTRNKLAELNTLLKMFDSELEVEIKGWFKKFRLYDNRCVIMNPINPSSRYGGFYIRGPTIISAFHSMKKLEADVRERCATIAFGEDGEGEGDQRPAEDVRA